MGLDLKLLIPDVVPMSDEVQALNVLNVHRDDDLFKAIKNMEDFMGSPIQGKLYSYFALAEDGESCYGELEITPYGSPIKYLRASKLVHVFSTKYVFHCSNLDSILGYLMYLPGEMPVFLYWC